MFKPLVKIQNPPPSFWNRLLRRSPRAWHPSLGRKLPSLKLTFLAPENGWLESMIYFLFWGPAYFEGLCRTVSFREGNTSHHGKFGKSSIQVGAGCGERTCYVSFQEGSGCMFRRKKHMWPFGCLWNELIATPHLSKVAGTQKFNNCFGRSAFQ